MKSEFYINKSEVDKVSKLLDKFNAGSCRIVHDNNSGIGSTLQAVIQYPVVIEGIPHEGELYITLTDYESW